MTTHQAGSSAAASATTMHAIVRGRYGSPADVLRTGQEPAPQIGTDEVLVAVRAR